MPGTSFSGPRLSRWRPPCCPRAKDVYKRQVYSREALLETVWKYDYMGDMRTVDVHIRRLREKIERDNAGPEFILTKWGVGYYFTDKD